MFTSPAKLCVLCVDDDRSLQAMMAAGLERHGIRVVTACHGIDGLRQFEARQEEFGAVLSDCDMPEMGGLEFVRILRARGYSGRIVIMSGRMAPAELRQYEPLNISGFFSKPFSLDLLATMLLRP